MDDTVALKPLSLLPSSPFLAPWVKPEWHGRIEVVPAPDTPRVWGRTLVGDCWLWKGWNNGKGHGRVWIGKHGVYLHRYSFEQFHGLSIQSCHAIDHLCRNRACFNPAHHEAVTFLENYQRGDGPSYQFKGADEYDEGEDLAAALRGF